MVNIWLIMVHTHDGSMVLGEICEHKGGILMINVTIYSSTMDPMGNINGFIINHFYGVTLLT